MIRSNVRVHKNRFMAAGINIVIMVIAGLQLLLLLPDKLMLLLLLTQAATGEHQTKT
jgi:nitrate reductase gamma subunit